MDIPKFNIESPKEFITSLPGRVKQEWLKGVNTNFHFDIAGDAGGQFSVIVKDEKIEVHERFEGEPSCKLTASQKNFVALLKGDLNPMMAVFSGKLKVSNPGEIMKYAKLFGLM